jgi:hypothetical protein
VLRKGDNDITILGRGYEGICGVADERAETAVGRGSRAVEGIRVVVRRNDDLRGKVHDVQTVIVGAKGGSRRARLSIEEVVDMGDEAIVRVGDMALSGRRECGVENGVFAIQAACDEQVVALILGEVGG